MSQNARERVLPDEFYAEVSVERALKAAERYRKLQFGLDGERPRASIPANPDDDDLVLSRFIEQAASRMALAEQMVEALEDVEATLSSYCAPTCGGNCDRCAVRKIVTNALAAWKAGRTR